MKWWVLFLVCVGFASGRLAAEAEVKVMPLAEGVWLHKSWKHTEDWGRVSSNGLVVREGDHVVVIDTAWGAEPSLLLLAWIDHELGLPVDRLIVTHFHSDRLGGWEVFAERGTRIVASERTLELAGVTPTEAFDLFQLERGGTLSTGTLEILYPGPAHAEDNVVVWVPHQKLLVGGCAVRAAESSGMGNVADATISEWANSMRRVQQAYPEAEHVLPGHGAIGGIGMLQHTIDLASRAHVESKPE